MGGKAPTVGEGFVNTAARFEPEKETGHPHSQVGYLTVPATQEKNGEKSCILV